MVARSPVQSPRRPGVAFVALAALAVPQAASQAPSRHPTAEETTAEFRAICRQLTDGGDEFFGRRVVTDLRTRLEAAGDDLRQGAILRGLLAMELLRVDQTEEVLTLLDEALRLAEAGRLPEALLLQLHRAFGRAHMQLAEDENCIGHPSAMSCRLPLTANGVHGRPEHMRRAGDHLLTYLRARPGELQVRWLANLARMISGDYPHGMPEAWRLPPDALVGAPFPRWRDLASELEVDSLDLAGGAVVDDFDGDGLLDLVSSTMDPCDHLKAFRNDGRGGFVDATGRWGLDAQWGGLNVVHADFDNDGRLDLLVLRGGWQGAYGRVRNSLLRNDLAGPAGRFVDVTAAAGLGQPAYPTQTAAWADYDGDGDLDLYVGNETSAAESALPAPSQLFRNQGDGTFIDVAEKAGVADPGYAKGVTWGDFDDDGDPDLYVSAIGPNRLYRNDGDGIFVDVAAEVGVAGPVGRSFACWFFDYDNDGDLDLLVADFGSPYSLVSASYLGFASQQGHPVLYRNDDGRFTDVSRQSGLVRPLLPMGANFGDLDNDGFLDFYLGTGEPEFEAIQPNVMYRNKGGKRFEDVSFAGGFAHLQKGHGVAFGDLDNDGDQEIFEQMGGSVPGDAFFNSLYENPGSDARWITLRLRGTSANRFAVGARVEVLTREAGESRSFHRLAGSGGSFGGSSLQLEIGLGRAERIERLTVRWPGSATIQSFTGVALDATYLAVEGRETLERIAVPRLRLRATAAPP